MSTDDFLGIVDYADLNNVCGERQRAPLFPARRERDLGGLPRNQVVFFLVRCSQYPRHRDVYAAVSYFQLICSGIGGVKFAFDCRSSHHSLTRESYRRYLLLEARHS